MREQLWNTYYTLVSVFRSNSSLRPGCREANRQRSPSRHQSMITSGSQHSAAQPLAKCHNKFCIRSSPGGNNSLDVAEQGERISEALFPTVCFLEQFAPTAPELPRQSHVSLQALHRTNVS